jgi:A/G-specific adenine glycosylase
VKGPAEKRRIIRVPHSPVEEDLSFTAPLLAWQLQHGRHDLPWQKTCDAYRIWLSEIMLQQTQVSTVIPYYQRFLTTFPDVASLAAAPVEQVIAHWAGLGYYARARNLHRCAQAVVAQHGGRFPDDPTQLAELPGIGRSTAAAIAAFAYGKRAAILDGNVKRVLCRHFGIEGFPGQKAVESKLWELAESLLPESGIEAYTQGLMDLGATCCTRRQPRCEACPVAADCLARASQRQHELPTARPKKAIPERRSCFVLISDGENLLLERRPPSGIWGGLLVPPEGEPQAVLARYGLALREARHLPPLLHTFTHFKLHIEAVLCRVETALFVQESSLTWIPIAEAASAGVPTPMRKLIKQVPSAMG